MVRTKQTARKSTGTPKVSNKNLRQDSGNADKSIDDWLTSLLTPQTARKSTSKGSLRKKTMKKKTAKNIKNGGDVRPPGHRQPSGVKALREIQHYRNTTNLLLRRLPFQRLVREICHEFKLDLRFHVVAMEAFQVFSIIISF